MNVFEKKQWTRIGLSLVAVIIAVLFLTGVIGGKAMTYQVEEPLTPMLQGITDTMAQNAENSEAEDYLEQDPYLVNIYEGFGFAKDYMAARGHAYTLEDVTKTARPHGKANCITCKTPDFTKMVNEEGVEVYSRPFDEVINEMTTAISCYTCHGDDKGNNGQIVITHSYVEEALGENASSIDPKVLNCGQCHIEYYFTPEDSETMMPYSDQEGMTPEAILAYYDEIGFKDWEQPGTGTAMLKAQHPEMETFLPSKHAQMGLSCSSCHMAEETAEDGSTYHSHYLVSPLQSETLMETCAACHGSADAARTLVASTQERVTTRETEVGNRLSSLKDMLTEAVAEGKMTEEELDAVRKLHREAQWFFDFCYVENSEGAHNSSLSMRCLDTAEERITEAMTLLTGEAPETAEPETAGEKTDAPEASGQGFGGEVTVHLTLNEDGTVQTLTIDTPNETAGLGQRASEEAFTSQFVGKAGPFTYGEDGIEALSGATVTSNAALEAINSLLTGNAGETGSAEEQNGGEEKTAEEEKPDAAAGTVTETPPEETAESQGIYGSYLAEKKTNFSVIRVLVNTQDDKITGCKITSEGENDYLTEEIRTEWAKAIIADQTAETDAITGATLTFSSAAVREAVAEILEAMNSEETPAGATDTEIPAEKEKTEAAETKPESSAEETAESQGIYGSYLAEKETNFSRIRVLINTQDDRITGCKITSEGENDYLTDEIRTEWAKAIIENQTAETDAITGATLQFSSGAVREAVAEILTAMSGAEQAAEEPAESGQSAAGEQPGETDAETVQPAEAPAAAEPEEKAPALFGSYLAVRETNFSVIRVIISTEKGIITGCKITSEGENDYLTEEIRREWAKAIVENGNAETDAITGATLQFSSAAVREAVAEILDQMK